MSDNLRLRFVRHRVESWWWWITDFIEYEDSYGHEEAEAEEHKLITGPEVPLFNRVGRRGNYPLGEDYQRYRKLLSDAQGGLEREFGVSIDNQAMMLAAMGEGTTWRELKASRIESWRKER